MSPPANTNEAGMETRMSLIEKEFSIVHGIFQKYETALEKMADASTLVQKLLAVHDQRITERERAEAAIFESIERRRDEYAQNAEKVSQKMDQMATELRKEIKDELTDLGDDLKESLKGMKDSQAEIVKKIDEGTKSTETKFKEMEGRVRSLENWRWLVAGGGAVVGFLVAKWSLIASLFGAG